MGTGALHRADIDTTTPAGRVLAAFLGFLDAVPDERFASFLGGLPPAPRRRRLEARSLPCLGWLTRAAAIAPPATGALAGILAENAHRLRWGQTYTEADFGAGFLQNYGWTELVGTRGHFESDALAAGFLLLGAKTHYPDHRHVAEEIYVPLTDGASWRMGGGAFTQHAAGTVIHHQSNVGHAMRTGLEPLLALYLWRGGPLAQRSQIAGE